MREAFGGFWLVGKTLAFEVVSSKNFEHSKAYSYILLAFQNSPYLQMIYELEGFLSFDFGKKPHVYWALRGVENGNEIVRARKVVEFVHSLRKARKSKQKYRC